MKNEKIKKFTIYISVFVLGALIMYGAVYTFPQEFSTVITKTEKDVTVTESGIADAVDKIYDAVVVVTTYKNDSVYSSGTGFVYQVEDNKAYIMTNAHVIESGDKVTVTFTNGNVVETNIVGSNEYDDIAVLTIDSSEDISVAELGNSSDLRVGDTSFAVGAPLDNAFSWTVTRGIISGLDRMVEVSVANSYSADYIMKVLQTDTAINSGNSGGPLCNSNGEVIGIATLKLAEEGVEGMGFAIPIEDALKSADDIVNGTSGSNPYLGIGMLNVSTSLYTPEYQNVISASGLTTGVIISTIEKNSPANKAGFEVNDIITHINGTDVPSIPYLKYELYKFNVGDVVEITVNREGNSEVIKVTLGSSELLS